VLRARPVLSLRRLLTLLLGAATLALAAADCGEKAPPPGVWFAPNLGSLDMVDLFTQPQAWRTARSELGVFKFYEQQLVSERPADCTDCGPNILPAFEQVQAFAQLGDWNLAIAVEVGVIKRHTCSPEANASLAIEAIRNVEQRGGVVRYLAMDEPLLGARDCGIGLTDLGQAAKGVATFARRVQEAYPAVSIGDVEPYPEFGVPVLTAWLAALRTQGFAPAFVHLDVDRGRAASLGVDVPTDLRALMRLVEVQQIPFGVIFWGADGTDETAYAADVLAWVETVRQAIGKPTQSVFQSWSRGADGRFVVPRNLPENDSATMTHTRLLDEGLRELRGGSSG
jgi:hypothetical protein